MVTIFTIPRAFEGEFVHIQLNALCSWLLLEPQPQVLLFGLESGAADVARELRIAINPVARNEHDTPLVNDALAQARAQAEHDILVMANADNIYMSDFLLAVQACARAFPRFLMIGQRWDLAVGNLLNFSADWEGRLQERVERDGYLHPRGAVDYLAFRDGAWLADLPPFAVGRTGYDNDIVARTLAEGIPVVDATRAVVVIHQDHAPNERHTVEARHNRDMRIEGRGGVGQANWLLAGDGKLQEKGVE